MNKGKEAELAQHVKGITVEYDFHWMGGVRSNSRKEGWSHIMKNISHAEEFGLHPVSTEEPFKEWHGLLEK